MAEGRPDGACSHDDGEHYKRLPAGGYEYDCLACGQPVHETPDGERTVRQTVAGISGLPDTVQFHAGETVWNPPREDEGETGDEGAEEGDVPPGYAAGYAEGYAAGYGDGEAGLPRRA